MLPRAQRKRQQEPQSPPAPAHPASRSLNAQPVHKRPRDSHSRVSRRGSRSSVPDGGSSPQFPPRFQCSEAKRGWGLPQWTAQTRSESKGDTSDVCPPWNRHSGNAPGRCCPHWQRPLPSGRNLHPFLLCFLLEVLTIQLLRSVYGI